MGTPLPTGPAGPAGPAGQAGPQLPPSPLSDLAIVRPATSDPAEPGPAGPNLAELAEAERRRHRRPRSLMLLTRVRIGLHRSPRMSRRAIRALAAEQEGIPDRRDPAHVTHGEAVVRSVATRRSDGVISRTARRLHRVTRRIDRLRARRATLHGRIGLIPGEHVAHPYGGRQTVARTRADSEALTLLVQDQSDRGSRKHHRAPAWFRFMPRVVLVFDLALLVYFMSGITDVNWGAPLSLPLAFAAGLALMITVVCYACFAFAGHRLRSHKDDTGTIPLAAVDWLTGLFVIACAAGIVVIGLLMFARMWSEVLLALGNGAHTTALAVAAAITVVSVLANMMVIAVHATDGSEETDKLDAFGATLRRPLRRENRLLRRADRLEHRIQVRARKAERISVLGMARSELPPALAEEIVGHARAQHQQTGPFSEATQGRDPRPVIPGYQPPGATRGPERALRLAVDHAHTELPGPETSTDELDQRAG